MNIVKSNKSVLKQLTKKRKKMSTKLSLSPSNIEKTYSIISSEFNKLNGYLTKLTDNNNCVIGYLARCEITGYPQHVCIIFEPKSKLDRDVKAVKTLAMARAIKAGVRKLNELKKLDRFDEVENFSFDNAMYSQEELEFNLYFDAFDIDYNKLYDYCKAFSKKINKYYKDTEVKQLWL